MRIAVTGATGFVGQHVLRDLHSRGLDAIAVTRSINGRQPQPGVSRWVQLDIAGQSIDPFQTMGRPDLLIHLAWQGLPNYQSRRHVEVELPAQLEFLTACIEGGLRRLVVTGTCYEYGLVSGGLVEDTEARPCSQYGIAKDELRKALSTLAIERQFDMAWLRLFYLYGDGQAEKSLFPALQAAIQRGDATFDMSGGDQARDFMPIGEAARMIVEVALRQEADGVFNVCSGVPVTVKDLVAGWIEESGSKIAMNLGSLPYSPSEPMAFWGDRAKLDSLLSNSN